MSPRIFYGYRYAEFRRFSPAQDSERTKKLTTEFKRKSAPSTESRPPPSLNNFSAHHLHVGSSANASPPQCTDRFRRFGQVRWPWSICFLAPCGRLLPSRRNFAGPDQVWVLNFWGTLVSAEHPSTKTATFSSVVRRCYLEFYGLAGQGITQVSSANVCHE